MMPERDDDLTPIGEENNDERFQSDTQKIVQRHLENEDDVISEEDIRNVRVGMTPPPEQRDGIALNPDEKVADRKLDSEDDTIPGAQKATPWDVIDPGS